MKTVPLCLAGMLACAGVCPGQIEIVVPNSLANVGGSNNNNYPFNNSFASQRYQQVYAASEFSMISGPHDLVEIRLRPNQTSSFTPWTSQITLDMRFSTTSRAPDQLSLNFDENVGLDETVVYSGQATLSTNQTGPSAGGAAMEFDIIITLQNPFPYDPAMGHLLMEVRREGATTGRALDAHTATGDGVSRLFTGSTGNSSSPSGSVSSLGLVTMFVFQPAGPVCYANCDGSTVEPLLNVDDFTCFINEYASAQSLPHEQQVTHYANCDSSTVAPALNVDDFTCFINRFAQGCR
jgi:hypothetical protein